MRHARSIKLLGTVPPPSHAPEIVGVTDAAAKLQSAGLIHHSRGHITVLDRPGLEAKVCECYQVVKREVDRLLPGAMPGGLVQLRSVVRRHSVVSSLADEA